MANDPSMPTSSDETVPFWRRKNLEELNAREWESLCDGCGQCCMLKIDDEDEKERHFTRLACKLLDLGSCRCSRYKTRHRYVPDCVRLDVEAVRKFDWLPETCGYRLMAEGRDLYWWHPLVSGDPETVHQAGVSVRGHAISETRVTEEEYLEHIVMTVPYP
jgi:uncharacterized cysteine cluster protein YcgN (CxxCxxCC family)